MFAPSTSQSDRTAAASKPRNRPRRREPDKACPWPSFACLISMVCSPNWPTAIRRLKSGSAAMCTGLLARSRKSARRYDDDFARAAEQLTRELTALAGIAEGQTVLDTGCGFGGTIASLNARFDDLHMIGLNIDARQLSSAKKLVRPLRRNSISFCQADACVLPFADRFRSRDRGRMYLSFSESGAFFKEVRRVLKPGGTLTLSDFVPAAAFLPLARWHRCAFSTASAPTATPTRDTPLRAIAGLRPR